MTQLTDVVGIGPVISKLLFDRNIRTVEELASVSMAELLKVPGFNENRARIIIKAAVDCLQKGADLKSAAVANNPQTTGEKAAGKKTIANKVAAQSKEGELKDKKKKKNKKDDKKKDKGKKKKDKNKGKRKNKS